MVHTITNVFIIKLCTENYKRITIYATREEEIAARVRIY